MYTPGYAFGQGSNVQAAYSPNGAPASAPQTPQHQLGQQAQQQMMYNPQQYGGLPQGYMGQPNVNMAMGPNAGMMQNGMAHMAANNGIGMCCTSLAGLVCPYSLLCPASLYTLLVMICKVVLDFIVKAGAYTRFSTWDALFASSIMMIYPSMRH